MRELICEWCNKSFTSNQPAARFCCRQHKKNGAAKRFRERNPGYYARYSKSPRMIAYVEEHKEQRRTQAREHMRKKRGEQPDLLREYNKEWFRKNRKRHVEYNRRRRAIKLSGLVQGILDLEWESIKNRQNYRCFYCNKPCELTQDHVIPLTRGGAHSTGNIVGACRSCNSSKCNSLIIEWKRRGGVVLGAKG